MWEKALIVIIVYQNAECQINQAIRKTPYRSLQFPTVF